jgi:hypothetical protein
MVRPSEWMLQHTFIRINIDNMYFCEEAVYKFMVSAMKNLVSFFYLLNARGRVGETERARE